MPQRKIRSILVDDEYFNRELIKMMIGRLSNEFEIIGEAEGIRKGRELITELKPDVVFLDIKMPDGSGFDLISGLGNIDFEVVFITGFDEFAIKALQHRAIDYVLKPIDQDKLKATLEKLMIRLEMKRKI